ncbi:hypothetical protein CsatB_027628 [Cannabis sativa]
MDICQNEEQHNNNLSLYSSSSSSLDQLFSSQNMQEEDLSLEWLSVFVEDCLTSSGNCLPPQPTTTTKTTTNSTISVLETSKSSKPLDFHKAQKKPNSLLETFFSIPSKARSKRKRVVLTKRRDPLTIWSTLKMPKNTTTNFEYPPLLKQTYWLCDSELIVPKKDVDKNEEEREKENGDLVKEIDEDGEQLGFMAHGLVARRCTHCLSQKTPQWRAGPLGPKTLCNACGVRYKSGRLLPEYRPAKSPTFVSYLHSNSHKKVMEMRNGS